MAVKCGPYISQENMLFSYLPNYSEIPGVSATLDDNQTDRPKGIVKGTQVNFLDWNYMGDLGYAYYSGITPTMVVSGNSHLSDIQLSDEFTISFWVKVNRFPTHGITNSAYGGRGIRQYLDDGFRRKRQIFLSFDFLNPNYPYLCSSIIFGALGPYYNYSGHSYYYQYNFEPFSFALGFISNRTYSQDDGGGANAWHTSYPVVSAYSDYQYSLNKWYLVSATFTKSGYTYRSDKPYKIGYLMKLFINDKQVNVASIGYNKGGHSGNVMIGTGNECNSYGNAGRVSNARKRELIAAGPGFIKATSVNTIANSENNWFNMDISSSYLLWRINCAPLLKSRVNLYSDKKIVNRLGTGVDFGQMYLYNGSFKYDIYNSHKNFYI